MKKFFDYTCRLKELDLFETSVKTTMRRRGFAQLIRFTKDCVANKNSLSFDTSTTRIAVCTEI